MLIWSSIGSKIIPNTKKSNEAFQSLFVKGVFSSPKWANSTTSRGIEIYASFNQILLS